VFPLLLPQKLNSGLLAPHFAKGQSLKRSLTNLGFCGYGVVTKWQGPDHTKVEEFRNRLSPATYKKIGDYVLQAAVSLGFADPTWMDLDSTVQEANIAYPADAHLMRKLAQKCGKVLAFVKKAKKRYVPQDLQIDLAAINRKAKEYFFLAKNTAIEKRREVFQAYHKLVKQQLKPLIAFCTALSPQAYAALPWHIRRTIDQITTQGWRFLLDVAHFIRTHTLKPGKILSFHCLAVACIRKGKVGKENEFGRVFQLGRIGGNFLIPFTCTDVRMEDKQSLLPAIVEHRHIFGEGVLKSVGTDKGYYSAQNIRAAQKAGADATGIQRPRHVRECPPEEVVRLLRNRRAGIEPLIGHLKAFGLGKSKMKSDQTTLASGYRAVLGFNLHQLRRHLAAKAGGKGKLQDPNSQTPRRSSLSITIQPMLQPISYFATATN
jgi:IS5 family transposase